MRIYRGRRHEGPPETISIDVLDDRTGRSYPLVESPEAGTSGMEWGYAGTGPHNTARAILADLVGDFAPELAGTFEREVIARLERPSFDLSAATIEDWLAARASES